MGTIVGSAMFNILVIVALAAAVTREALAIDWRPVVRDCAFYSLSILMLYVYFQDSGISKGEALSMVIAYVVYILFMVFNQRIFSMCGNGEPSGDTAPSSSAAVSPSSTGGKEVEAKRKLSLHAPKPSGKGRDTMIPVIHKHTFSGNDADVEEAKRE